MNQKEIEKRCPEIPFWGASYPDARCVNGRLYDLDKCNDEGNLYEPNDDMPCPFCKTDEFIECDPFGMEDKFFEAIIGNGNPDDVTSDQIKEMQERSRKWYIGWIERMREKY